MTRIEKTQALIENCISEMSVDEKEIYRQIAEFAVELGYTPKPIKTAQGISNKLSFKKAKISRTLLKINPGHQNQKLALVFYATPTYSDVFQEGIKRVIEEFDGRYTGCYSKCKRKCDKPQGYTYVYPDGKTVFRCGGEYIELSLIKAEHVNEIKSMMKAQDDFWLNQLANKETL